mgnify:CR=1 FL=1
MSYILLLTIIDFYGRGVVDMADRVGVCSAELDTEALDLFRRKFDVGRDADDFTMNI